jgi:hypothetical protein
LFVFGQLAANWLNPSVLCVLCGLSGGFAMGRSDQQLANAGAWWAAEFCGGAFHPAMLA